MNARELMADVREFGPGLSAREVLLYTRVLLRYLADNAHDAELSDGRYLGEIGDFVKWLRELAEETLRAMEPYDVALSALKDNAARVHHGKGDARDGTRASVMLPPAPQRRWEDSCPRCGHVHQGDRECGEPMGGGRICRCELEVQA